jgi:hypothetical protein
MADRDQYKKNTMASPPEMPICSLSYNVMAFKLNEGIGNKNAESAKNQSFVGRFCGSLSVRFFVT